MKPLLICVMAVVLGTLTSVFVFGDPPTVVRATDAEHPFMAAKLTTSQRVLDGLVRRNFAVIEQGAREMKAISEADEWPRPRDPVFEHFAREFRRQCNKLESLAKDRNQEGATFVYLQMTSTCVQCHDYVRDSMRIATNPDHQVAPIPSQWRKP